LVKDQTKESFLCIAHLCQLYCKGGWLWSKTKLQPRSPDTNQKESRKWYSKSQAFTTPWLLIPHYREETVDVFWWYVYKITNWAGKGVDWKRCVVCLKRGGGSPFWLFIF
jgi:hypothetical protein